MGGAGRHGDRSSLTTGLGPTALRKGWEGGKAGREERTLLRKQKQCLPTDGEGCRSEQPRSPDSDALSPYDPFSVVDRGHFRDLTHE